MPTNRTRGYGGGGSMPPNLIGLFATGSGANHIPTEEQRALWLQHGRRFLDFHWRDRTTLCWAEWSFGRPWVGVAPMSLHDEMLQRFGHCIYLEAGRCSVCRTPSPADH
ncbi:hypothetical protein MRB56_14220 [Halomonas cupida]|uniref:hypothetical protein n=1 Tax=Halomonas cupida TaxID=44933 RepID=UPI0039B3A608